MMNKRLSGFVGKPFAPVEILAVVTSVISAAEQSRKARAGSPLLLKKPMPSAPAKAFQQLSQNRLFEGIGAKVLERIRPDVNILQLKRGDVVFKEGDLGDSLYL